MKKKLFIIISVVVLSMILSISLVACGNKYADDPIIGNYLSEDGVNYIQISNCKAENPDYEYEQHFRLINTYIGDDEKFYTSEIIIFFNKETQDYEFLNHNVMNFCIYPLLCDQNKGQVIITVQGITLKIHPFFDVEKEVKLTKTSTSTVDEWKASKPWLA